ncbi:MAG TPA: acetyl-CoA hydrolase/transferase C-terminal domain-containing protein [Steroidobacteraceae bacterium]|nr:acetyl-CoA hydrolase/transferase C-terminal domain-containing protein [Steroidobacteraceae bacterium]
MDERQPRFLADVGSCVEQVLSQVGSRIVLCLPIGAGKPMALANEFWHRAVADRSIELTILTGLTLRRPRGKSELERRLVEPMAGRVFAGGPDPAWSDALAASAVPSNIRIQEFFMEPGAWLHSPQAQQWYASINYTHVARTVLAAGANVIAQQIALRPGTGGRASLGTNPDVSVDLLPIFAERRRAGRKVATIGQVNAYMPFMFGAAEVPASAFDFIVDDPRGHHELFSPPNLPISTADHCIALANSMLIRDGGTIQIGIGELGDAIVHSMTLRHRENATWRRALADTGLGPRFGSVQAELGGDGPFEHGLYAVTEMFVDGFLDLYHEGILKRRVEPDGVLLHGAFMLGPQAFYRELREMPDARRALFAMMPVSFTNELLGPGWERKLAQRRDARFMNTTMMVTLGGALVSDGLADGRVVSGVGGQYNFIAQAHQLPGGRSLIAVRATRDNHGSVESNIRYSYGSATIPRHLRDVVVTEYGVADIRGLADDEVARRLLAIADSRFQDSLLADAKRAGKLPASYRIPDPHRNNLPAALERALAPHRAAGFFGELPFGTDLTAEEIRLGRALRRLKSRAQRWPGRFAIAARMLRPLPGSPETAPLFERMGLASPRGWRERLLRRVVAAAL